MTQGLQITKLHKGIDKLHLFYGDCNLNAIYGAGCVQNPNFMFIFMNPTGKNVSSNPNWAGLRAPWLGTKNIWKMISQLGFISNKTNKQIQRPHNNWTPQFSQDLYTEVANNSLYITNLAKCTQPDARPLKKGVFKKHLVIMFKEIELVNPKVIVTFGQQVSSLLLNKAITMKDYANTEKEILFIGKNSYDVYPTFYPVGQGLRNMPKAIKRIKSIKNPKST